MTPAELSLHAREAGFGRSDRGLHSEMILNGYDSLISGGFVTRSDVYFSAPEATRLAVAKLAQEREQAWAPGNRSGLHNWLRRKCADASGPDLEVCVRYGPIGSLYGDLYANLRRYELLLWGFLVGVLVAEFGADDEGIDWRSTGWWQLGVPESERVRLSADWSVRTDVDRPWKLADFGTMQKVIDRNKGRVSAASGDADARSLTIEVREVARIRNSVMHPLAGKDPQEREFVYVTRALEELVRRVESARSSARLNEAYVPSPAALMMPEILRERLYPPGSQSPSAP